MPDRPRDSGRQGASLIELLVVVGIMGSVGLFVFPSVARVFDHVEVGAARTALVNLYHSARTAARVSNRMSVLRVSGNRVLIERNSPNGTAKDTLGPITDLMAQYGVLVSGPDSIRIDARGMLESNLQNRVKYLLTRGDWSDSVMLSNYGRVTR